MFRADPAGIGSPPSDAPRVMRDLLRTLQDVPGVERVAIANNALLRASGPRPSPDHRIRSAYRHSNVRCR